MVNRVPKHHGSAVTCDNFGGGQVLAAELLGAGHRTFAVIRGVTTASTSQERERGFAGWVAEHGAETALYLEGTSTYEGGFDAGRTIAQMPAKRRPAAVFAVADIMAMGVMDGVRSAGLHVPQDISVVGFDGIAAGGWPSYGLTTVRQPIRAMIGRGLDLLAARLADGAVPDEVVSLRGKLIVRQSARLAGRAAMEKDE